MTLEQKKVPSNLYLIAKNRLTIPQIQEFAAFVVEELYSEIEKLNLNINGPCEFIYLNCTGELDKEFDLKIAIPILEKGKESDLFEYFESASYSCVSKDFTCNAENLGNAWDALMKEIELNKIVPSEINHCREVYKSWTGPLNNDNITELQIQI